MARQVTGVGGQYPVHIHLYANRLEHPKVLVITEHGRTEFVPHYNEVPVAVARLDGEEAI